MTLFQIAVAASCASLIWTISPIAQPDIVILLLLLVGGTILGLPHGALDYFFLREDPVLRRKLDWPHKILAVYIALALLPMVLWVLVPAASLLVLLGIAAFHLGMSDSGDIAPKIQRRFYLVLRGGLVLILPLIFYRAEVAYYFSLLSAQNTAGLYDFLFTVLISGAAPLAFLFTISTNGLIRAGIYDKAIENLCVAALFLVCPPLLAFVTYWVFWHALPHMEQEIKHLKQDYDIDARAYAGTLTLICILSFVLFFPVVFLFPVAGQEAQSLIRLFFIALLCLTVPHVLLHLWREK